MKTTSRYKSIRLKTISIIMTLALVFAALQGCSGGKNESARGGNGDSSSYFVDFEKLKKENSDIFGWIHIPDTDIDYPVVQSSDGDDSFYKNHNSLKESDSRGAIYIEAANMKDMCDFNEVIHGSSPEDGSLFAGLEKFLDRNYFDEHTYIYIYLDGNALIYYVFAAYTRDDERLLEQYDFSYASGCQAFLDEIYGTKTMGKIVRSGWEDAVRPENFLVTLSTVDPASKNQIVVVGCLVGDVAGKIDRFVDYSDPE